MPLIKKDVKQMINISYWRNKMNYYNEMVDEGFDPDDFEDCILFKKLMRKKEMEKSNNNIKIISIFAVVIIGFCFIFGTAILLLQ